jgi:hypothetical protein
VSEIDAVGALPLLVLVPVVAPLEHAYTETIAAATNRLTNIAIARIRSRVR